MRLKELSRFRFLITSWIWNFKLVSWKSYRNTRTNFLFFNLSFFTFVIYRFDIHIDRITNKLIFLMQEWKSRFKNFTCLKSFSNFCLKSIQHNFPVSFNFTWRKVDNRPDRSILSNLDQNRFVFLIFFKQKFGLIFKITLFFDVRWKFFGRNMRIINFISFNLPVSRKIILGGIFFF
jgi:hypothetical protein